MYKSCQLFYTKYTYLWQFYFFSKEQHTDIVTAIIYTPTGGKVMSITHPYNMERWKTNDSILSAFT